MQSDYSSLAARRYRQYKRAKRKETIKKKTTSFVFRIFQAIIRVLQKVRILRRKVETIKVENG